MGRGRHLLRLPKMPNDASSEPIRDWPRPSPDAADSLARWLSAADMLSMIESLTDDSESLAERRWLRDS